MFKNGFTTIGENFISLIALSIIFFVIIMWGASVGGDLDRAINVIQWFFLRIIGVIVLITAMILGTIYAILEVFSRRNYKPIPPKTMSYNINNIPQLTDDNQSFSLLQPSGGDENIIEGATKLIEGYVEPKDIY